MFQRLPFLSVDIHRHFASLAKAQLSDGLEPDMHSRWNWYKVSKRLTEPRLCLKGMSGMKGKPLSPLLRRNLQYLPHSFRDFYCRPFVNKQKLSSADVGIAAASPCLAVVAQWDVSTMWVFAPFRRHWPKVWSTMPHWDLSPCTSHEEVRNYCRRAPSGSLQNTLSSGRGEYCEASFLKHRHPLIDILVSRWLAEPRRDPTLAFREGTASRMASCISVPWGKLACMHDGVQHRERLENIVQKILKITSE